VLFEKIKNRESGIILYGIVPPKRETSPETLDEISRKIIDRLPIDILDGLVVYDIQDEVSRTTENRPFPFIESIDGFSFCKNQLKSLSLPKIIYRAIGKYSRDDLSHFLSSVDPKEFLTVFVGAASKHQKVGLPINEAYFIKKNINAILPMGGVMIPERHLKNSDEHLRVFSKIENGCSFFVSQGVYDITAAKNFLSDYHYYGLEHGLPLVPIIFTLTPCGSAKTLQFMKWLGISIPRWLENELMHSQDILEHSLKVCAGNWAELNDYASSKNIPIGCNIESVAIRKVEVEASFELLRQITKSKLT
jgi:Methylenetetrahydrofolate reductase